MQCSLKRDGSISGKKDTSLLLGSVCYGRNDLVSFLGFGIREILSFVTVSNRYVRLICQSQVLVI